MTKDQINTIQTELNRKHKEFLTQAFGSRPKGRGNLSKKDILMMCAGFADGLISMREALIARGSLVLTE